MSDEQKTGPTDSQSGGDAGSKDSDTKGGRMGDGIRQGIGVLSAFKDALEETIQEARDRGDLSAERAKEVMKDTLEKAQEAAEGAKGRIDFATQADLESVKAAVDSVKLRLGELEGSVFGAAKTGAADSGAGSEEEVASDAADTEDPAGN